MSYHYFYVIENTVTGRLYAGKHSTNDLDDGYMGSGTLIKRAIRKHGVENFRKHIMVFCDSADEAFEFERQVVNEDFVNDPNTYNVIIGGDSFAGINANETLRREKNHRAALAMNRVLWSDPAFRVRHLIRFIEQTKRLHAEGKLKSPNWTGRHHRKRTKEAIGRANSVHQTGKGNSQFGTIWISNHELKISRKVLRTEFDIWVQQGWIRGRKMKWKHSTQP